MESNLKGYPCLKGSLGKKCYIPATDRRLCGFIKNYAELNFSRLIVIRKRIKKLFQTQSASSHGVSIRVESDVVNPFQKCFSI